MSGKTQILFTVCINDDSSFYAISAFQRLQRTCLLSDRRKTILQMVCYIFEAILFTIFTKLNF